MSSINLFYEGVRFRLRSSVKTKSWIRKVIKAENKQAGEINYIFCTDKILLAINQTYLNHDTLTDIITFDNAENSFDITGDIYISIDRVKENASRFQTNFLHELHRVMIHGILHLLGYSDKGAAKKKAMREKEDTYLSLHKF